MKSMKASHAQNVLHHRTLKRAKCWWESNACKQCYKSFCTFL